jgi:phosphatidylinositol dimannoside acyltransferase
VTAVVERLQQPDVFDWFVDLRSSYGIHVVPAGPDALAALAVAVRRRHVVCLLADRDLSGGGLPVEFFGAPTTLPAGPAVLSMRTGAPVHVTAVYFTGSGHHCVVGPPLRAERRGRLREDAQVFTQRIAVELEALIRRAPEQWHVLEPLWGEPAGAATPAGIA